MTHKTERHRELLAIVRERPVATQDELRRLLKGRGHGVDQATLSRDIRELGLVKAARDGATSYATLDAISPAVHVESTTLVSRMVLSVECSGNLVIVKTSPGNASPVGLALDRMHWSEVVGTVAGDDTLFVAVREGVRAKTLAKKLLELRAS